MLEVETEEGQKESVFGDLDCNDNTPVLQPQIDQQKSSNEMSPTKSTGLLSSPIRSSSRSSNMSDLPPASGQSAIPGLLYSPEDTLNNDFFYDDEFSVPFDANITEAEMKMLDSMDLNAILRLSKQCAGADDDNVQWQHEVKMTSSKSDTCLSYQAEVDGSDSDREMDTSGERDIASSSELSDFKSEPLFSPPPEFDSASNYTDSMGREELSSSYSLREEPRYNYDWTANKHQYVLSFDRSPSKQSDSSTGRTPTPSDGHASFSSWTQRSLNASQTSWGSMARHGPTSKNANNGSGVYNAELYRSTGRSSTERSSTGSSANTMMTWRQVKERSSPDRSPDSGMTTWKTLREECHCCEDTATGTRSKSLPDLKANQSGGSGGDSDGARSVVTDCGDEHRRQHSARTLLELFQRSRSCGDENGFSPSVSMEAGCEAMISPTSLNQLTGTWSVSPVHSDGSYATAPQTLSDRSTTSPNVTTPSAGMVSWGAIKNTQKLSPSSTHKPSAIDTSTQVSLCSESGLGMKPRGSDLSVQCAPCLTDCGIQTSFVDGSKYKQMTSRSLQTSASMGEIAAVPDIRVVHRSHSQPPPAKGARAEECPELVVQLSARARERMSRSAYFVSRGGLPDLSFLNKFMSQSAASTPSPKESLHSSGASSPRGGCMEGAFLEEKPIFKDFKKLFSIGRVKHNEVGSEVPDAACTVNGRPFTRDQLEMLKRHQRTLHQMERMKILEEHTKMVLTPTYTTPPPLNTTSSTQYTTGDVQHMSSRDKISHREKQRSDKTVVPSDARPKVSSSNSRSASPGKSMQNSATKQLLKQTSAKLSQIPRKPSRIPGMKAPGPPTMKKPQLPVKTQASLVTRNSSPKHGASSKQAKPTHPARPAVPVKPTVAPKSRSMLAKPKSQIPTPNRSGAPSPSQSQERVRVHEKSISRIRRGETGESRESSPGLSGSRRSRSTDSASTNNSFCSSSSSGIDPGSYESHHHHHRQERVTSDPRLYSFISEDGVSSDTSSIDGSRRAREREYWGDCEDNTGRMSRKDSGLGFSGHKSPTLCTKCKEQMSGDAADDPSTGTKPMTASHPTYSKLLVAVEKEIPHSVEYLLVSPTRKPKHQARSKSLDDDASGSPKRQPPPKPPRCRAQLSLDETSTRGGEHSASDTASDGQKKPLKSCLVKRRKGLGKGNALKHRSWSDPYDGMVLKYSLNGEIRYQLVTHDAKCAWRHSTGDLPVQVIPQEDDTDKTPTEIKKPVVEETPPVLVPAALPDDESPITPVAEAVTPPNSPEQIPLPTCACRTTHAVLHSSSDSSGGGGAPEETTDLDCCGFTGPKKSVSFSEEVRFHSPHASPHQSPRKAKPLPGYCDQHSLVARHPLSRDLLKARPKSLPQDLGLFPLGIPASIDPIAEAPPNDFMVSPTKESAPTFPASDSMIDLSHKREIALDVIRAAEVILQHFSSTRDPEEKVSLGSTAAKPEIGELLLTHLCPAIHAVVLDGLNPHVRSLFGKVRNSAWKMVEDSADQGPSSRILNDLVRDLKALDFLDTTWLKFNAFIYGLLNHKALDFWLSHIQSHPGLVSRHYSANSFFALSSTATKSLFLDMTTSLQPLAQMPFRLEYNFEFRLLKERHQKQMADYMLEKHVSHSADALIEGHQALQQRALGLDSSTSTTTSLHADLKGEVSKQAMAIGKQTREYLQLRGKRIFQRIQQGELLAKTSSSSSQVPKLKGINDSATTTSSSTCTVSSEGSDAPPSLFQNSESDDGQTNDVTTSSEKTVQQIVKNNEILGDLAQSDITSPEGLFSKLTRQFKEIASPGQDKDVYKKGVTEYEFDSESASAKLENSIKSSQDGSPTDALSEHCQVSMATVTRRPKALFDARGMPKRPLSHAPEFEIPRRGSVKQDKTKHLSDSSSSSSSSTPSPLKRWSSLGPKLIKAFDKLLLDSPPYGDRKGRSGVSGVSRSVSMDSSKIPLPSKSSSSALEGGRVSMNTASARLALQRGKSLDERALNMLQEEERSKFAEAEKQPQLSPSPPSTPIGSVKTLCHYVGTEDNQLSFEKGLILALLKELDEDWLVCRQGNKKGLVHRACVKSADNSSKEES